jgi:hypothetical protein
MNELKKAQKFLKEKVIRSFWKRLTHAHPHTCVNDGLALNYNKPLSKLELFRIVDKLTKCSEKQLCVATPLYQYNYDPGNQHPHHISALTLKYNSRDGVYMLNMFNPKGKSSTRKKQEEIMLLLIARLLRVKLKRPVVIHRYMGPNLQQKDDIGLCQLYSLFYLFEYVQRPANIAPTDFIRYIKQRRGHFNEKTLLQFWCHMFKKT